MRNTTNNNAMLMSIAVPVVADVAERVLKVALPVRSRTIAAEIRAGGSPDAETLRRRVRDIRGLQPADRSVVEGTIAVIDAAADGDAAAMGHAIDAVLADLREWTRGFALLDEEGGRWEAVGHVVVDSGILLVTDVCQAGEFDVDEAEPPAQERPYRFDMGGARSAVSDFACGDLDRARGFVAGVADGMHPVLARFEDERLVAVRLNVR